MRLIENFFKQHHITASRIAVGVSGGADSLALVLLLKETFSDKEIVALTVDHGLRPTARQEAEYVAKVMAEHNIEHHILTWEGKKPQTGIEEAARSARYDLLCGYCKQHKIKYLAVAHHLYDQAETFLMRLERGSGLFGLSSMSDISERAGIKILRPLLHTAPEELKAYLKKRNISWVEDESNQCTDFLRVKMRKFLPILEKETGISPARLATAAENLQDVREFVEATVAQTIDNDVHQWGQGGYSVDYSKFLSWHRELQFYTIGRLIQELGEQYYQPEATALKELIKELHKKDFAGATLGGVYFCLSDLRLWLIKEYRGKTPDITDEEWQKYTRQTPAVRGLKIPAKLKQALIFEKKHKN